MKTKIFLILTITLFLTTKNSIQSDTFEPHPDNKINPYLLEKDYSQIKFTEKIGYKDADFEVQEVDLSRYDEEWQGVQRQYQGDNYFTVSMKSGDDVVRMF